MPIPPTTCFRCGAQLAPADRAHPDHCARCLGLVHDALRAYRAYLAALCALDAARAAPDRP